jgi:hypothetical protein
MTRLVFAWVLVNGVLMVPAWLSTAFMNTPGPAWVSVEAALIVGSMSLLPRRPWTRGLAWVVAGAVLLTALVRFGDLVFQASLGRSLNLSIDLYLLDAVRRLAVGNMGALRASVGLTLITALGAGATYTMARLLGSSGSDEDAPGRVFERRVAGAIVAVVLALWVLGLGVDAVGRRVATPMASLVVDQVRLLAETRSERAAFEADLATLPGGRIDVDDPMARLEEHDVALVYLESYGMAALEDPELAAGVRRRLETAEARLGEAGVHVATGRLTSPTLGGQSWYAHGTMLSGLWLGNQLRYELMLTGGRDNLLDDFGRAGYRTATVMPAITTPWPEAERIGYDAIYTAQNIPYRGPPFYWVTMPDQFTWSFVGDLLEEDGTPLFVEVGMVSSHAPWTPVVPLVDWDAMDEGRVFEPYRLEGYPPEEIWWDVGVLRDGYAQSMAYSVEAMVQFAERFLDDGTLLIVAGDHQAAPWVTDAEDADVPVHVFARDAALLEPFLSWGFESGTLPGVAVPTHRMDRFREWFVRAYSGSDGA